MLEFARTVDVSSHSHFPSATMKLFALFLLFVTGCCSTRGAKILGIFPYQGRSHNIMIESVMVGLARAGHSVDLVSHFPPEKPVPGLSHISLKGTLQFYVNNLTASEARSYTSVADAMKLLSFQEPNSLCNLMRLSQLQNVINTTTKYDVMVTEVFGTNCYLAVAHKLQLPVVGIVTSAMYPWAYDAVFDCDNPSYVPTQLGGFSSKMSFFERLQNLGIHLFTKFLWFYYDKMVSEPLARKYLPDTSTLNDLYFNMSIMLVNSHWSINGARPTSPAVVEVAGVHIDETQELSKELAAFLDSSINGVVYFSMGSMVKSETFSIDKIQAIYESFDKLSGYNVLWKGNIEEMPKGLPSNVKMVPWLPQYAVLRHPNVKVFVTHGGLMGTLEAIHAGVPMIGIPLFADQLTNVAGYVQKEIAVRLDYEELTKASFSHALNEVLNKPKYKSNVERVSRLFKDRPLSPIDEAVFWVEYVVRNGGDSLKSSALHLYWFQYYLIDIGLFLLAVTALLFIVVFRTVKISLSILAAIRRSAYPVKVKTK